MSIFRTPKGVYVRQTPDWFLDSSAVACGYIEHGGGGIRGFALYNNDTRGRSFYIYVAYWSTDIQDALVMGYGYGPGASPLASPYGCWPLNPLNTAVPGIVYSDVTPVQNGPILYQSSQAANAWQVGSESGAPIAIIPPGWSLVVITRGSALEADVAIRYQFLTS